MDEKNSYMDRILTVPYCCNNSNSAAETMALMQNNPLMYLVLLGLFGNGGFGWGNNNRNDGQYIALSNQIADNNNAQYVRDAIQGNGFAISQLAQNLNADSNAVREAIGTVKDAIFNVGASSGMGFAGVMNAINLGNLNIIQQLKDCCCASQKQVLEMGYQNQIQTINQTNDLQAALRVESGLTRSEIASFRQAWENSRYQDVVAEKTRLQTELDLLKNQDTTQAYFRQFVTPLQNQINALTYQLSGKTVTVTEPTA